MYSRQEEDEEERRLEIQPPPSIWQVVGIYGILPLFPAILLPLMTEFYRSTQDSYALLSLLIAKRLCLYLLAIVGTAYAGWRGAAFVRNEIARQSGDDDDGQGVVRIGADPAGAGSALDELNREILKGEIPSSSLFPVQALEEEGGQLKQQQLQQALKDAKEKEDDQIFAALDGDEKVGQTVALALPFILTGALSLSYILLQGQDGENSTLQSISGLNSTIDMKALFAMLSLISNSLVCLLFSSAEYRSFFVSSQQAIITDQMEDEEDKSFPLSKFVTVPNILALTSVLAASILPLTQAWPFQNSINLAIAVTVTRALAPFLIGSPNAKKNVTSILTVALALSGLAIYDLASVLGTSLFAVQPANALVDMASNQQGDGTFLIENISSASSSFLVGDSSSVMETVARAKFSGPWQPGLLEMVLVGRISDVLGLGDIVFPACLVSWGFVMRNGYAAAAIGGYVLGSFGTEVVTTLGPSSVVNQGLPALIFIAPAMLGCVSLLALSRGEFEELWSKDDVELDGTSS